MILSSKFVCIKLVLFIQDFSRRTIFSYLSFSRGNLDVIQDHSWSGQVIDFINQFRSYLRSRSFYKTDNGNSMAHQLSMTADAAIRIVWHSAEVVHFHHNIRYIRQVNPWVIIQKYADNQSSPFDY